MARKQCRLWWPDQLLSREPTSDLVLFGWYICSSNSVDVIVAHAASAAEIWARHSQLELQEILQSINSMMPMPLQEISTFCILGHCAVHCSNGGMVPNQQSDHVLKSTEFHALEEPLATKMISNEDVNKNLKENTYVVAPCVENSRNWSCGCQLLNQSLEPHWEVLIRCGNWIQLYSKSQGFLYKNSRWIPEFHHMHQNGHFLSNCDGHLMIYEPSTYGGHHFSVRSWGYCEQAVTPSKKPNWFNELNKKSAAPNLEAVVLALNCTSAAMVYLKGNLSATDLSINFYVISRSLSIFWHFLAVCVASISAVMYVLLQLLHRFLWLGMPAFFSMLLQNVFTQTWNSIHIRSCQFLYWPIILLGTDLREQSNVEYAHMAALKKHSIWSSIFIDVIMGIVVGIVLLANVDSVYFGTLFVARSITDNLLRSGCVWLMGVPAGFKLNTELAEILGMVSLNAIQIFSTLWFLLGSLFWHFIRGLALSGIVLGLTVPAALCIDMLNILTLHIQTLHWLMSFLYSRQIQALAFLWRLFRGRKWNPLRQRLDSYDYTVEQHVVGSLLFTPILLLLPTTSVFYIFFTILNTTVCFICIIIEITISLHHATPYATIFLWMVRRRRFPSGIWFELISHRHWFNQSDTSDTTNNRMPEILVSLLHSNYATIVQIVEPSYRNLFRRLGPSLGGPSAYGVLSGRRTPSMLQINHQPSLPWMQIRCKEYWSLCYRSVLACRSSKGGTYHL